MKGEVIAGRLYLLPPKGILEELKPVILDKFNGKCCKYISDRFQIPSRKMNFIVETIVDDHCEVCPIAVEMLSELAAKFDNITVKIYNATYVKPPFNYAATPAFRINNKIKSTGIPLNPDEISKYFMELLKEAYIVTHPKIDWLVKRLETFGKTYGYHRNPNIKAYANILYRLLKNIDKYGYPFCPCRKIIEGKTPQQTYELNKDKICPCIYAHSDIKKYGHCLCGLFWSKEKVEEYVKRRLEQYGWIIKEIEIVQKQLEELKRRVISGGGKELAESILNRIQIIYAMFPES